jgi:hypothetical protein
MKYVGLPAVSLTALALIALALPAAAQTTAATSVTTASSAALFSSGQFRPAPDLREARVLATAAFERPPAPHITDRSDPFEVPPLKAKEEWSPTQHLYLKGTRLAYKTRF